MYEANTDVLPTFPKSISNLLREHAAEAILRKPPFFIVFVLARFMDSAFRNDKNKGLAWRDLGESSRDAASMVAEVIIFLNMVLISI